MISKKADINRCTLKFDTPINNEGYYLATLQEKNDGN